jgi:hypothetical protein
MQYAMGVMVVEVRYVFGQHSLKEAPVDDQHPVQQFAADSCDPSFGDGVRSGCLSGSRTRSVLWSAVSGRAFVLVDQATENWSTPVPPVSDIRVGRFGAWWVRLQCSVRPLRVVVRGILGKHSCGGVAPRRSACGR